MISRQHLVERNRHTWAEAQAYVVLWLEDEINDIEKRGNLNPATEQLFASLLGFHAWLTDEHECPNPFAHLPGLDE